MNPCALKTFNPSICLMLMLGCLFWNHFHQEFLGTTSLNGAGFVCVISITFNLNCCMVMDNPHSCIANAHSTMVLSSSFVNKHVGPMLRFLVLPFR